MCHVSNDICSYIFVSSALYLCLLISFFCFLYVIQKSALFSAPLSCLPCPDCRRLSWAPPREGQCPRSPPAPSPLPHFLFSHFICILWRCSELSAACVIVSVQHPVCFPLPPKWHYFSLNLQNLGSALGQALGYVIYLNTVTTTP